MKLNVKKSTHIRVGKRFKETVVPPVVELNTITVSTEIWYLGLTFVSVLYLRCNLHKAKAKFFGH